LSLATNPTTQRLLVQRNPALKMSMMSIALFLEADALDLPDHAAVEILETKNLTLTWMN
jgi:hypothetical protein